MRKLVKTNQLMDSTSPSRNKVNLIQVINPSLENKAGRGTFGAAVETGSMFGSSRADRGQSSFYDRGGGGQSESMSGLANGFDMLTMQTNIGGTKKNKLGTA